MSQYFSDILRAITGNPDMLSVYNDRSGYNQTLDGPPTHLENYAPSPVLPENGVDVIANPMLTIPTPRYEGEPPQMLEPNVVLADPLDDFQAKADEGMLKTADTASPGFLSRFMGAGSNKDFNRMLLAAGAGMLSKPGAQGLGQAAANVGEVADAIQKREDDAALKQAKVAKMYADMKKGAKTTSDGMGGVWVTPADGSPPYRLTDAEFREAKMGNLNSQSQMNTAKLEKLKQEIARGSVPKFIQKIGDDAVLVQKPDGTFETLSTPEMQAAGLRMNNGKLERAVAQAKAKAEVEPMSGKLQEAEDEDLTAISTAGNLNNRIGMFLSQIEGGKLRLGTLENLESEAKGRTGVGADENSRNYMLFKTELEDLRNKTLMLNKGVQTEGDAMRAMNAIMQNLNDPEYVKRQLRIVMQKNEEAIKLRQALIDKRRQQNYKPPLNNGSSNVVPRGSSQADPLPSEPSSPPPRIDGLDDEAMKYLR